MATVTYEGKEYVVHGPQKCPRRCSLCPNGDHHWIEYVCDPNEDPDDYMDAEVRHSILEYDRQHGTEAALACYVCKHCPAWVEAEYVWALEECDEEDCPEHRPG